MLKFIRQVLATIVGIFLFTVFSFFSLLAVIAALVPDREARLEERPVLRIVLNKNITERETDDIFGQFTSPFTSRESGSLGLIELRKSIKEAARNNHIKGILLDIRNFDAGMAQIEELRNEIKTFKESGKFVYAWSDNYSEAGYFLASVADKIFLPPIGDLEFNGLSSEVVFFKGTLDMLNVQPEIFRVGDYKSAIETFTQKQMSEENREQMEVLLNSVYDDYLQKISDARGVEVSQLRNIADSILVQTAEDAQEYELVTHVAYFDSLESIIREETGIEKDKKVEYARYDDLYDLFERENDGNRKVAVIVAEGSIEHGSGRRNIIGSHTFSEEIRKARLDDDVKAIVLRINSPGGSALASDLMWREVELTGRVKPVIASMSDVAASGGYYMAAACDTIVAQPNTITGSIGVFGLLVNLEEFLNNKLGITTDRVKTNPMADIGSATRPMTERERGIIQKSVNKIYEDFLEVVAKGRDLDKEYVHSIAQGRVWSGIEAKENKLSDVNGGLEDAIKIAAEKAGIEDDYSVVYLPELPDAFLRQILRAFDGSDGDAYDEHLGKFAPYVKSIIELQKMEGVQARMPYDIKIK
ncbi:signal peptide peptidase SppA [Cytophagaceae bacterium ABcell3]|nr:signal peptide peptidase SppA [Cytophagaceae bacterium ABcell3]